MAENTLYEQLITEFTQGCKERVEFAKQITFNNNSSSLVFELSKMLGSYATGFISACKIFTYQKILTTGEFCDICDEVSRIWNWELAAAKEDKDREVQNDEQ